MIRIRSCVTATFAAVFALHGNLAGADVKSLSVAGIRRFDCAN